LVNPAGVINTVAGTGGVEGQGSPDRIPAGMAHLTFPEGVGVDPNGILYVADEFDHRIRILTPLLSANGGDNQTAASGQAVVVPPSVLLTDALDRPRSHVSVTFAITPGRGMITGEGPPGNSVTVHTNDSGIAQLTFWTLGASTGTNTLTATLTGTPGSPVSFTATVPNAAGLQISAGNNQAGTVNTSVATAPAVVVTDAMGHARSGVSVTFMITGGGGSLTGEGPPGNSVTVHTNDSGIAQLNSWKLGTGAGDNTLTASLTGVAGSSVTFHASAGLPRLNLNGGNGQVVTVGAAINPPPSVLVTDALGHPLSNVRVTFASASSTDGSSVIGPTQVTGANGIATVGSWMLGPHPAGYTLTATAAGLSGSPTASFTAYALAGSVARITVRAGDGQTAAVGTPVATAPAVVLQDAFGNPVTGATVTFKASGDGSVAGSPALSDVNGIATLTSWKLGTRPGPNTLTVSVAGVTATATLSATARPGPAAKLAFATDPSNVVPGQLITPAVVVLVEDQYGNVVTTDNSTVSIDLANNPGGSILGGNRAVQADHGRATFNVLFLSALGSGYTLIPSDSSLQRPSVSRPFDVKPVSLTSSASKVLAGQSVTFTFRAFSLSPYQGNPYGLATFSVGGVGLGSAPVNADGLASLTTALPLSLPNGDNIVTACYNDPIQDSTAVTVVATSGAGVPVTIVLGAGDSGVVATLKDGAGMGTVAGTLTTNVPLAGQFHPPLYTLPANFGDDALFTLVPGSSPDQPAKLETGPGFVAAFASRRSYTVQVQSDIGAGTPAQAIFTIFVAPSPASSPARTTTKLTSSPNPSPTVGQPISFTATLQANNGSTPTGSVLFVADGTPVGTSILRNGSATLSLSTLAMGNHAIAAIYTGDGTLNASTSDTITQTIGSPQPSQHGNFNIGVYDPLSSTFYLHNGKNPGPPDAGSLVYGLQDWKPVSGDFTGGKKTTVGIVDPSGFRDTVNHRDAYWFLGSANGLNDIPGFAYGYASWTPIAGDWTGSGRYGIGAYDPASATFYLRNETSGGAPDAGAFQFGAPGWIPLVGDWTGSGRFGIGAFDPTTATFYLRNELSSGAPDAGVIPFGLPFWKPVVGDWSGSGRWTIGVVDPSGARDTVNHRDAYWFLSDDNKTVGYTPFPYGFAAWTPLAGVWNPPAGSPTAATGVAGTGVGPLLDPYAVARLARAESRHTDALDSLFATGI
jgi:hypothetical protein